MVNNYSTPIEFGQPVRQLLEVQSGETLEIFVKVPGGTLGKTFTSDFKHSLKGSPEETTLDPGAILDGSFSIVVVDKETIKLATQTGGLARGRYLYDIRSVYDDLVVSISGLKEFIVVSGVTGGSPLPQLPLYTSPNSQRFTITPDSLVSDKAVITHSLDNLVLDMSVFDDEGELYLPWQVINSTTVEVDFSALSPVTKTYSVLLER